MKNTVSTRSSLGGSRALIIQGPLISDPRPDSNLSKWAGSRVSLERDGCSAIKETLLQHCGSIDHTVVVTWNDTTNESGADRLRSETGITVLCIDDPGVPPVGGRPGRDNKYRQAIGVLAGLEYLQTRGFDGLVARTRTDQIVNVEAMLDAVETTRSLDEGFIAAGQKAFIHVPAFFRRAYRHDDFYFAGHIDDLLAFFAAQQQLASLYVGDDCVHGEYLRKHILANLAKLREDLARNIFIELPESYPADSPNPRFRYPSEVLDPYVWSMTHSVVPLPRAVYENVVWRGQPFQMASNNGWVTDIPRFFLEEWCNARGELAAHLFMFSGGNNWFSIRKTNWLDRLATEPFKHNWMEKLMYNTRRRIARWRHQDKGLIRYCLGQLRSCLGAVARRGLRFIR